MKIMKRERSGQQPNESRRKSLAWVAGGVLMPASVIGLGGCATAGGGGKGEEAPSFVPVPPADGKAAVYFYRTSSMIGVLRGYTVFVDDKPVGNVDSGSWRRAEIEPGRHALKAEFTTAAWTGPGMKGEINVEAGQIRFVRIAIGITTLGPVPAGGSLLWASNNQLMDVERNLALFHLSRLELSK